MDPTQQAMAAALMGGQNSAMPSAIAPQPDPSQFSPQMTGYGQPMPSGMPQQQMQGGQMGMFSPPPYGAQAQMNMTPQNMMGYGS
jgi:hypothetical protein